MRIDILAGWKECHDCDSKFAAVWGIDMGIMCNPLCFDCFLKFYNSLEIDLNDELYLEAGYEDYK
jgi:hypothetical protein